MPPLWLQIKDPKRKIRTFPHYQWCNNDKAKVQFPSLSNCFCEITFSFHIIHNFFTISPGVQNLECKSKRIKWLQDWMPNLDRLKENSKGKEVSPFHYQATALKKKQHLKNGTNKICIIFFFISFTTFQNELSIYKMYKYNNHCMVLNISLK